MKMLLWIPPIKSLNQPYAKHTVTGREEEDSLKCQVVLRNPRLLGTAHPHVLPGFSGSRVGETRVAWFKDPPPGWRVLRMVLGETLVLHLDKYQGGGLRGRERGGKGKGWVNEWNIHLSKYSTYEFTNIVILNVHAWQGVHFTVYIAQSDLNISSFRTKIDEKFFNWFLHKNKYCLVKKTCLKLKTSAV